MNYNALGTSGLNISEVSFGTMSLQGSDAENAALIEKAIDAGINYFDTADLYDQGRNEQSVGKALKGKRKDVIIATKVGNQWRADGSGWDWNPRKEYILSAVEGSLQRLQTDYIDLYQLHGGTLQDPIDETIEAFELLQQQGKIRCYGISSIRPNVIREYVKRSRIVSVMMQYSLLDRRPEEECLELLQQHHICVLARGSVAKGLLVDKPAAPFLNYSAEQVQQAAAAVKALSNAQRGPAQTALRFVLQHPATTSAVVGIRTSKQLADAVDAVKSPSLSMNEMEQLRQALAPNRYQEHR
ncbi:aldo/keto reductase [uncultured Chitinophaga sp.]|jgi:Predicted oxidoreductases (related to aryl-alcohol dehydrogenases)|uniref:aldo/keto reductase n=1 Tax=uncultured Chitinophaga sp. TaxID=339340 RepID=UPI00262B7D4F|nr:aldo/keto reductase [uncultured Chitinophaga sp.]